MSVDAIVARALAKLVKAENPDDWTLAQCAELGKFDAGLTNAEVDLIAAWDAATSDATSEQEGR